MEATPELFVRNQLQQRRRSLEAAAQTLPDPRDALRLLQQVDAVLHRLDDGSYGRCVVCTERFREDELIANPLVEYCLCHLSPQQMRWLERDLQLAGRIQWSLLPPQNLAHAGWETLFRYLPAGLVSGDYCDLVITREGEPSLYFLLGDVSGKGVAAALRMAHLNASFRSLIHAGLPIVELLDRVNRLFHETAGDAQYATLVCGVAHAGGKVQLCNAGHCPPVVVTGAGVTPVQATGFPLGLLADGQFAVMELDLAEGASLFVYTDGLTEARNAADDEYGADRVRRVLAAHAGESLQDLTSAVLRDQAAYLDGGRGIDDLTILALRRLSAADTASLDQAAGFLPQ